MTFFSPNPFAATHKANLASLFALTNTAFEGFQKLAELNLQTAKSSLIESQDLIQAVLAGKDLRDVAAVPGNLTQPAADKVIAYARHLYEIASNTQAEVARVLETQYQQHSTSVQAFVDNVVKNAPAGSEVATTVLQAAVAATNGTYDAVQKVAKQVAEAAKTNFDGPNKVTSVTAKRAAA